MILDLLLYGCWTKNRAAEPNSQTPGAPGAPRNRITQPGAPVKAWAEHRDRTNPVRDQAEACQPLGGRKAWKGLCPAWCTDGELGEPIPQPLGRLCDPGEAEKHFPPSLFQANLAVGVRHAASARARQGGGQQQGLSTHRSCRLAGKSARQNTTGLSVAAGREGQLKRARQHPAPQKITSRSSGRSASCWDCTGCSGKFPFAHD